MVKNGRSHWTPPNQHFRKIEDYNFKKHVASEKARLRDQRATEALLRPPVTEPPPQVEARTSSEIVENLSHAREIPRSVGDPSSLFSTLVRERSRSPERKEEVKEPEPIELTTDAEPTGTPVRLKFKGEDAITIHIERDELGASERFSGFVPHEGAKTAIVRALAQAGVKVSEGQIDDEFIKALHSATRSTGGGMVKKKSIPDGVLEGITSRSTSKSSPPRSVHDVLESSHEGDMAALQTRFHGAIPEKSRYLVALNIRSDPERDFLASSLGIPKENVISLRDSGVVLRQIAEDGHHWHVVMGKTATKQQKTIEDALEGKTGCSVTVLAHYDAGGQCGAEHPGDKPTNVGGLPANTLASWLGSSVQNGRLNFFVCGARSFAEEVGTATARGQRVDVTSVGDGVAIQPHKSGPMPQFFYKGPPLESDGGKSGAPKAFDPSLHASVRDAFTTLTIDDR